MNVFEIISFILYFVLVIGIGIYFFLKSKIASEKEYFLGGRNMNGWVSALSAGASDMSAWVLMGLPGAICLGGFGQIWISIGLLIGTILAWIFVAPRLRRFAIAANDSITIPEFLSNRFLTKSNTLRVACAIVFLVGYCLYSASSIVACGDLFNLLTGLDKKIAMLIATIIIVIYTLLGGFKAVCWTDFFQGMLMLMALMIVPIVANIIFINNGMIEGAAPLNTPNFYNLLSSGKFDYASIATILTGLGWGLGYFGMPHILVRYMAIKSEKEMRKSQIIGSCWTFLILFMATFTAIVAHEYLGNLIHGASEGVESTKNLTFIFLVRDIFKNGGWALIGGLLLSAIVAASMSTADSQLLASSSAFASDIYKTTIKKDASDKEMLNVGRISIVIVSIIAFVIALLTNIFNLASIMELVSAAWSIFGAAFGPIILLSLYWKRFNVKGAVAGLITGFSVSILWLVLFNFEYYGFTSLTGVNTGIYEIVPAFILNLAVSIIVSLCTEKPSDEVVELFKSVKKSEE